MMAEILSFCEIANHELIYLPWRAREIHIFTIAQANHEFSLFILMQDKAKGAAKPTRVESQNLSPILTG
jgi:hypothetical protein